MRNARCAVDVFSCHLFTWHSFYLDGGLIFFLGDPVDPCSEPARSHLSPSWEANRPAGGEGVGGGVILGIISVYTFERPSVLRF